LNKTGKVEARWHETRTPFLSPLRGFLPPLAGALPKGAMKMARQVRLVGEPGRQCDLGQGKPVPLRGDHLPGVPQPALEQVLMGRAAYRRPKHLHKMVGAQTGDPGRLLHRHAFSEALVKETNCPLQARVASRAVGMVARGVW